MVTNNAITSGNAELDIKISEWLKWDKNTKTLEEIKEYIKNGEYAHLSKIFLDRIKFGTAGLRGRMAAGYTCMNDLVIVQTAQGLIKHLEQNFMQKLIDNGIVLGYDGRHNSKRFAELTASVFLHKNYKVRMFSRVVPTPFVPFTVTKFKCAAGIMVTASHNPKEDNGYKLYGNNGCQIISPTDKTIQKHILNNLEPLSSSWSTEILDGNKNLLDPIEEVINDYVNVLCERIQIAHKENNKHSDVKFTYTAMHGVGYEYIVRAMDSVGLKVVPVVEQMDPDPEFPTVKFPNPEEGKSCLDLSIKTANAIGSPIILANDPDADRLAIAEKNPETGEWKIFNGNEIGALLGWWLLFCHQKKYPNKSLNDVYMLSSTVSSKILRSIARIEGFQFIETLTGFKWMGNKTYDLLKSEPNSRMIFAFEEAIGFMCGSDVLDKDGISAAVHVATLSAYLYHHELTLTQQLSEIYKEYGMHVTNNSYFICYAPETIKRIFERLRNFDGPNTYPKGILNNKYEIISVRDLTTGYDNSQPDNKAVLPVSKSSQMITFEFANGYVITLRTSGTEPKIKYYSEMCGSPSQTNRKQIEDISNEMIAAIIEEFYQPERNQLICKTD